MKGSDDMTEYDRLLSNAVKDIGVVLTSLFFVSKKIIITLTIRIITTPVDSTGDDDGECAIINGNYLYIQGAVSDGHSKFLLIIS